MPADSHLYQKVPSRLRKTSPLIPWRRFTGLSFDQETPHYSRFSKNHMDGFRNQE